MGTRADFYVGRGPNAEWLGSIGYDGYPSGIADPVLHAVDEDSYRRAVEVFLSQERSATLPSQGWPWPWEDSRTTDFAYSFHGGKVWASGFGRPWVDPLVDVSDDEAEDCGDLPKMTDFPNMAARQKVALDGRSGLLVLGIDVPPDV